jgi:hypothetical protein
MAKELAPIDISNVPELLRLAEEVRTTNTPRVLRRNDEDIAVVMPIATPSRRAKRTRTQADLDAFLATAGGWQKFDAEAFKRNNAHSRRLSTRPPVEL